MFIPNSYKENHPNPLMYRCDYEILDGPWDFVMDYHNRCEKNKIYEDFKLDLTINVPYPYLSKLSGINIDKKCNYVWYRKNITISNLSKDIFLIFEGADYHTKVYVNKRYVGESYGGYHRFEFNITDYLNIGNNEIVVKCEDSYSLTQPRGKQRFLNRNYLCWYTETTGIYKTVWIEKRPKNYIKNIKYIPSFKNKNIRIDLETIDSFSKLDINISYKGNLVYNNTFSSNKNKLSITINLDSEFHPWDSLKPELYDAEFILDDNDKVLSYFGIRDIYIKNNKIWLNDHIFYQKLILDQGYESDSLMSLSKSICLDDINTTIDLGFNGARKHQKKEIESYYSYADFIGYVVWLEMPSMYLLTNKSKERFKKEWMELLNDSINHPSIITYVPFNESWGIWGINKPNKKCSNFVNEIVELTKEYDNTRLVISNDGWSHLGSDILTIHNYSQTKTELAKAISDAVNKNVIHTLGKKKLTHLNDLDTKPIMVTEFGGTSFDNKNNGFGYGKNVKNDDEFKARLKELFDSILDNERICGYCYTQLTDVMQEQNGLLTMDRKLKIDKDKMKEIQRSE